MTTINTNILDDTFNDLFDKGIIYCVNEDTDDCMSYDEMNAVEATMEEALLEEFKYCYDFEEAVEALEDIIEYTSEDAQLFYNLDDFKSFYCNIDEENREVEMYGVPEILKHKFRQLLDWFLDEREMEMTNYTAYNLIAA